MKPTSASGTTSIGSCVRAAIRRATEPPIPRLAYSLQEAAEALRISERTVHRMIRDGRLKSVQVIRTHIIPAESIAAFLAQ